MVQKNTISNRTAAPSANSDTGARPPILSLSLSIDTSVSLEQQVAALISGLTPNTVAAAASQANNANTIWQQRATPPSSSRGRR